MAKPIIDRMGFKLDPIRDSILIQKLNEIDEGARSYVVRQALRHFFFDHNGGITIPSREATVDKPISCGKPEDFPCAEITTVSAKPCVLPAPESVEKYEIPEGVKAEVTKYQIDTNLLDPDEAEINAKLARLMGSM